MMKIFKSKAIALILVLTMIFTFSFASAIASTQENNEVKAFKVDNYDSDITDSYHPKALIEWLQNEYNIIITDYYIKAGSESSSAPQGPGGFFDSEGDNINDDLAALGIDHFTSNNEAFNQNLEFTVQYNDITLGTVPDGGETLPYGISHVLFLYTVAPDPTGVISVEKVLQDVDGSVITDSDATFTISVSGSDYEKEHTFSAGDSYSFIDLPLGEDGEAEFVVEETSIPQGYELVSIQSGEVVTDPETDGNSITITVNEDSSPVEVIVTNKVEAVVDDIDDDEVPEGVPKDEIIDDIDDDEIPEGAPRDEIILDEEVPLGEGELPRTGQRHVRDFYILGLMLSGLGVVLKRYIF